MTFVIADRVKETTTTSGTGTLTLAGASTGFRAFSTVCANNDTVAYAISSSGGAEWETGLGTWGTGGTLARTTVIASSNAGAAVTLSAGSKDVYLTVIAAQVGSGNDVCDGRLTLTSVTPVTTSDVTAAGTIYWTPYRGNEISLFNGGVWRRFRPGELSYSISATSANNYDLFVWNNAGTITLSRGPAWTSDTARGTGAGTTELELLDGVYVNKVSISGGPGVREGRYVGTFRASGSNITEDSAGGVTTQVGGKRFIFNMYNRVERAIKVIDKTDSWSYGTDTIRQADAATGNKVEYVSGIDGLIVEAKTAAIVFLATNSAVAAKAAVGIDSTTTFSGCVQGGYLSIVGVGGGMYAPVSGTYRGDPGIGYHYLSWNEKGADGTCTFLGDNGGDSQQAGLVVSLTI